ncbi:MAG: DUF1203 domain-containing protein [Alphaproteobacteria bacterium]|nr:DUF1203 domain-containing protein [Alphaproteobacteria bacterium]
MEFRITGLAAEPFAALYGLSDGELAQRGVRRYRVDQKPGFPDRVTLRDVEIGEHVLLLNHVSQPADSPYRATHAIFVHEGARETYDRANEIPDVMRTRLLSLRGFDTTGMMLDAEIVEGAAIEPVIAQLFANPAIAYIHVHFARRGCYAGRIDRLAGDA